MKQILKKAASVQMLCMILGIVFFQNVLADSGAVEKITLFLKNSGIASPGHGHNTFVSGLVEHHDNFRGPGPSAPAAYASRNNPWNVCSYSHAVSGSSPFSRAPLPGHYLPVFKVLFPIYRYLIPAVLSVTVGLAGYHFDKVMKPAGDDIVSDTGEKAAWINPPGRSRDTFVCMSKDIPGKPGMS